VTPTAESYRRRIQSHANPVPPIVAPTTLRTLRLEAMEAHHEAVATERSERLRRVLNITIALVSLMVLLPLLLVIAALVKLSSPGPVFYTQPRVGIDRRNGREPSGNHRRSIDYGGRIFQIYKFRTMKEVAGAEDQVWASENDWRVTRIGRVLRKYRLDELPQLINVLKGDMNIVGPRPEQPDILIRLRASIREYPRRQRVLPGITGLAQVNHHYDRSLDDVRRKLQFDLDYLQRRSAMEDIRIMARTVPVVLLQKGGW
jgi:lipopolysaccharide/colanic/teichoic acid biosynthesis glycosyltransferase